LQFVGALTRAEAVALTGKVRFTKDHPFHSPYKFLKSIAVDNVVAKQTIPAPAQFVLSFQLISEGAEGSISKYYSSYEEFFKDVSEAYHHAILAFLNLAVDIKKNLENNLFVNNNAIKDLPNDLIITSHICHGNFRSCWSSQGGHDFIAETFLSREIISAYFLEFENERSGTFASLFHVSPTHFLTYYTIH
jgi:methionine synthase II (cobalamin-independent)